jgi:hypothetical protein
MSGPLTIHDGELATKDPADILVYVFDFGEILPSTALISGSATFTVTAIRPAGDTNLSKDSEAVLSGNRTCRVRLTGGTLGAKYRIDCQIVTNELPAQTIERSFFLKIEQK